MKHANRGDFGQLQDTDVDLKERVRALACELDEALEQQIATSEVLRAISSSPGELELIFQTMLANAIRICSADFGALFDSRMARSAQPRCLAYRPHLSSFGNEDHIGRARKPPSVALCER